MSKVRRFTLAKLSNSAKVALVRIAAKLLPAKIMSSLASRSSVATRLKGAQMPKRSAAMYGMMAALPNEGDLQALVGDVLDKLTDVDEICI